MKLSLALAWQPGQKLFRAWDWNGFREICFTKCSFRFRIKYCESALSFLPHITVLLFTPNYCLLQEMLSWCIRSSIKKQASSPSHLRFRCVTHEVYQIRCLSTSVSAIQICRYLVLSWAIKLLCSVFKISGDADKIFRSTLVQSNHNDIYFERNWDTRIKLTCTFEQQRFIRERWSDVVKQIQDRCRSNNRNKGSDDAPELIHTYEGL